MRLIYENPLSCPQDVAGFVLEGKANIYFADGRMRMENELSQDEGQRANYVYWCDWIFPDHIMITWEFRPIREPGLAILFLAAEGTGGEDIFSEQLQKRTGEYPMYHHGDINAYHISYFRRKEPDERNFHTCNLRKSYGFHLVAQGADPIPDVEDVQGPYHLKVVKQGNRLEFFIDSLKIFAYEDDGKTYGARLKGGRIGFRQLAPMIGEYSDLKVYDLEGEPWS